MRRPEFGLEDHMHLWWAILFGATRTSLGNPIFSSNNSAAYVFGLPKEWRERDKLLSSDAFQALTDTGVQWNPLGLSFPGDFDFGSSKFTDSVVPAFISNGPGASVLGTMLKWDHRLFYGRKEMSTRKPFKFSKTYKDAQPLFDSLRKNGYATVSDWGLDVKALAAQAKKALDAELNTGVVKSVVELPALKPLLGNKTFHAVASGERALLCCDHTTLLPPAHSPPASCLLPPAYLSPPSSLLPFNVGDQTYYACLMSACVLAHPSLPGKGGRHSGLSSSATH